MLNASIVSEHTFMKLRTRTTGIPD